MEIRFVVATRKSEDEFWSASQTGQSLKFLKIGKANVRLFPENTQGLPIIYNQAIKETIGKPVLLIFAHDDISILDFFWIRRILDGLERFKIIGVAGSTSRISFQPSWFFSAVTIDQNNQVTFTREAPENLSGVVAHGSGYPPARLDIYGKAFQKVALLDGLLMAAKNQTFFENSLFFDERFMFDHYDLDLCRQAELLGLDIGTCLLSIIHSSTGNFKSDTFIASYKKYIDKWKD